ncbi:hypothetical protein MFRU_003g00720 [Monilinia fructicola]|uniref:Extracellular membrane protein CFEM domain-containing protein n=2 Tax=Monilinia TaxID=38447 RepID=A0A5M9JWI1_MONFR|nr:hypothetical protein EYC84_003395 [Monilinia fructicola]KAB8299944.1 hypothetical protein EYC80_000186 [Monilinia laxa]KAG4034096.1 hypothetical protein MFRU_003g00720 [Monilinia fructicola]
MVKFSALAMLALAFTAQACTYCQCKFQDGSHCCVYSDPAIGNLDCPSICAKAHRADGASENGEVGTPCNAGGSYKCASPFTALDRAPCYKQ